MIFCEDAQQDEAVVVGYLTPEETTELQRELDRFREDALHFDSHRDEFLKSYPEQWVAIHDKQVVAVAPDHRALLEQLDARGIPRGRVYRAYVTDDDVDLFL